MGTPGLGVSGNRALHAFEAQIPRPIGELPNDEEVLVNALCAGRRKGLSLDQALNQIHTVQSLACLIHRQPCISLFQKQD